MTLTLDIKTLDRGLLFEPCSLSSFFIHPPASPISCLSFNWHLFQTKNPIILSWPLVLAVVLTSTATFSYLTMCLPHNTCYSRSYRLRYTCCCSSFIDQYSGCQSSASCLDCNLGRTWGKFLCFNRLKVMCIFPLSLLVNLFLHPFFICVWGRIHTFMEFLKMSGNWKSDACESHGS